MTSLNALPNAILFAGTGLLTFALVAVLLFRGPLIDLWKRASVGADLPASLVVAALLLGLAFIVGSAVH